MRGNFRPVPEEKFCKGCGETKPTATGFHWRRHHGGDKRPQTLCRPCFNLYKRTRYPRHGSQTASKRRRDQRMKICGKMTPELRDLVFVTHGFLCLCCGSSDRVDPDHIVPVFLLGPTVLSNLQPLCRDCNGRKGIQVIDYRRVKA